MSHPTILLIDFDASSIDHAKSSLTQAGYHVEVAHDGISGLAAFERLKPDLVLVEAILPKKHGFQVCQEIKQTPYGKCTPILVTSSEALGAKYVQDALQLYGCDEYVEKPVSDMELVGFCQRLLPEVVVEPKVAVEIPDPGGDGQRLDDLTEDELMQRLDQLIDRATMEDGESSERDLAEPAPADEEPERRPLGEVDLVSFCERVFPRPASEDVPQLGQEEAQPAPQRPPDKPTARLLNEEEVVGQLDALARKDPKGGLLARPATPAAVDLSAVVEATITEPQPPTPSRGGWSRARRSRLVWRTGVSGAVLVVIGLILLAVARGHQPGEPAVAIDLSGAGPLATPPAAGVSEPAGATLPAAWDSTPIEVEAKPSRPSRSVTGRPAKEPARSGPVEAATTDARPQVPGTAVASPSESRADPVDAPAGAADVGDAVSEDASPATTETPDLAVASLPDLVDPEPSFFGFSSAEPAPSGSTLDIGLPAADPAPWEVGPAPEPVDATPPPPPTAKSALEIVPIESVDRQPIPIEQPLPAYDTFSRRMRRQGTVVVDALIDEQGEVTDVRLVDGIPRSSLNQAALDAVRGWRYRPAMKDGAPVKVWKTISLEFKP